MEKLPAYIILALIIYWIYRRSKKKKAQKANMKTERPEKQADNEPLELIETRVAGVTFENDNGTSRQEILKKCKPGEPIKLVHSPMPEHEYAVKVLRENGEQLGHIPREDAEDVADWLNSANTVTAKIKRITGGKKDKPTLGCVIEIRID